MRFFQATIVLFLSIPTTHAATFTSCPTAVGENIDVSGSTITITGATTFAAAAANLQTQAQNSSWQTGEQWGVIDCTGYTVVVNTGVTLTMQPVVDSDTDYTEDYGVMLKADNLTITGTGSIAANANGYTSTLGPGKGADGNNGGGGGGHGGTGGSGGTGAGGAVYESTFAPYQLGSAGGRGCSGNNPAGGTGGGVIRLEISGTLSISGTVTANGGAPTQTCSGGSFKEGGAGSGGSIYVNTNTLTGSGTFSANGGDAHPLTIGSAGEGGGGGGGGRIAIYYNSATGYTANLYDSTVNGGIKGTNGAGIDGTKGTLAFIDNNGTSTTTDDDVTFTSMHFIDNDDNDFNNDENYNFNNITFLSGVNDTTVATVDGSSTYILTASGTTINLTKAVIDGSQKAFNITGTNATLTIDGGSDLKVNTTITVNNLTVASGATIDSSGDGQTGGVGAGSVIATGNGGGGAGYGGRGGNGSSGPGGGVTYGSVYQPGELGSGGGLGCTTKLGGTGGGRIKLFVNNTLTLNGSLLANGAVPTESCGGGSFMEGGGGSGGSIWISTPTITGSGNINAKGGNGNPGSGISGGGGGGGGRIAIYRTDGSGYSGIVSVEGGTGSTAGSGGAYNNYNKPNAPSVTIGTENIVKNVSTNPTLVVNDFSGNGRRIHIDWVISSTNSCSSPAVVWSSYDNSTSTSSIVVNNSNGTFAGALAGGSALANSTTYYACVRDNNSLDSDWSSTRSFVTAGSDSSYVSTNWNFNTAGEYAAGSGVQVTGGVGKLILSGSAYPSTSSSRTITIDNSTNATTHSNYQVKVAFSAAAASSLATNCKDIRVGSAAAAYNFWIESCTSGQAGTATVWAKVPSITANGSVTMLISYSNSNLSSLSSGSNTFVFFDDFETYTGWTNYTNGTASQVDERAFGGTFSIIRGIDGNSSGIHKSLPSTVNYDFGIEARIYKITGYVGGDATRFGVYDSSGNGYGAAFNHSTKKIIVDKVNAYTVTANANSTATDSGLLDQWDRLLMTKFGSNHHVEIYNSSGTLKTSFDYSDSSYSSFDTAYIRGNYDVYLDNLFVRKYSSPEPSISVGSENAATAYANITLTPANTFSDFTALVGFVQTLGAAHAGSTDDIRYQVSCDGTNWYYHPGGDGSWTQANNPSQLSEISSAAKINGYIGDFIAAVGGSCSAFRFRTFLSSDGIQQKEIDNVELRYYAVPSTPSISSPASAATGVSENPTLQSSSFSGSLTHSSTDWEIYDNASLAAGNLVWSKYDDSSNKTSIVVNTTNGTFANSLNTKTKLNGGTQYWVRVRHTNSQGDSSWSTASVFTVIATVPATPTISSPTDSTTDLSRRPTVVGSTYNSSETHLSTDVQISTDSGFSSLSANCNDYAPSSGSKESVIINSTNCSFSGTSNGGALNANTLYYVRLRYTNLNGDSEWSPTSSFRTTNPRFSGTIANQTWNEDEILSSAFDLDSYFSNPNDSNFTYSTIDPPANITVSIGNGNVVSLTPAANFTGTGSVSFRMSDAYGATADSNSLTLTVNDVNDTPNTPLGQFIPSAAGVASTRPILQWKAGGDIDTTDTNANLTYKIWINYFAGLTAQTSFTGNGKLYEYSAISCGSGTCSFTVLDSLSEDVSYAWKVRTVDDGGLESDWSAEYWFTINADTAGEREALQNTAGGGGPAVATSTPASETIPQASTDIDAQNIDTATKPPHAAAGEAEPETDITESLAKDGEAEPIIEEIEQTSTQPESAIAEIEMIKVEDVNYQKDQPENSSRGESQTIVETKKSAVEESSSAEENATKDEIEQEEKITIDQTKSEFPYEFGEDEEQIAAPETESNEIIDKDEDQIDDQLEILLFGSPSIIDNFTDSNNDGLTDLKAMSLNLHPAEKDTDRDGMIDTEELKIGLNPLKTDTDGDGFLDNIEILLASDPLELESLPQDENSNKVADSWEDKFELEVLSGWQDSDLDGCSDKIEFQHNTNPKNSDTDSDGYLDCEEIMEFNTDPNDRLSAPLDISEIRISNWNWQEKAKDATPVFKGTAPSNIDLNLWIEDSNGQKARISKTRSSENQKFIFESSSRIKNGQYAFYVTGNFNGQELFSNRVLLTIDFNLDINQPLVKKIGSSDILKDVKLEIKEGRPVLSGTVEEKAQVIVTWQSLIYTSTLLIDTAEGDFESLPQAELQTGEHKVDLYAYRLSDNARSENIKLQFNVLESGEILIKSENFLSRSKIPMASGVFLLLTLILLLQKKKKFIDKSSTSKN